MIIAIVIRKMWKKKGLKFESVFKANEYIDKCLQIPKDVTKEELMQIWHQMTIFFNRHNITVNL